MLITLGVLIVTRLEKFYLLLSFLVRFEVQMSSGSFHLVDKVVTPAGVFILCLPP